MMENQNYYKILGVSTKASLEEITSAKNALAKKYHPDANMKDGIDTTEQMQLILEAYRVLSNPTKRAKYDREISGRKSVMQTFDLRESENVSGSEEPTFVTYWKAAGELYDIILESDNLYRQKQTAKLGQLAMQALKPIFILRNAGIPEQYWHPDIMNWLLFAWYKNRNYSTAYLLSMYDEHIKKEYGQVDKIRMKSKALSYARSVKKLMKY
ncbi:MAG: J domain-containing protein [Lachnospiraceae bacterium]